MSKNNIIIALVVLCLVGTIWGSVQSKKSAGLERQLTAMKSEGHAVAAVEPASHEAANSDELDAAVAKVAKLKAQNQTLLAKAASLKGNAAKHKSELATLKKELAEADKSQVLEVMQAQRDQRASKITNLEKKIAAVKAELAGKMNALVAAEEANAGFEDMKNSLANSVDAYSEKSQVLSAELEGAAHRVAALNNALEERTRLLVDNRQELARVKLNMNVLLSRIAGQNNSLAILEETRVALEKELANQFLIIEELQRQLSAQIVVDAVIEAELVEEAAAAH